MKQPGIFKGIALFFYLFIFLMGDMICLPFFLWLLFTLFDFGNTDQFFALLGVAGLAINCITFTIKRTLKVLLLDITSFFLMASPIIRRMSAVPIEKFNYPGFFIPATLFGLFYIFSLYYSVRQYIQSKKPTG